MEPLSVNTLRAAGGSRALLGLKENGDSSGHWATRFRETETYAVGFPSPVDTCRSHFSRIQRRLRRAVREGRMETGRTVVVAERVGGEGRPCTAGSLSAQF